jgi:Phasin protein
MHKFCCKDGQIQATKSSCIATVVMFGSEDYEMEGRGRRSPRMTAPADTPISQPTPEAADPVKVDKPVEESLAPPDVVVQRILPSAPTLLPSPAPAALPGPDTGPDFFDIIAESRAALARGVESVSEEVASLARHSIDTTAHSAIQMLGVKTWADAIAVNTSFARTSFDYWLEGTAKVSELGVKLAVESSKPFVTKFGKAWSAAYPRR